MGQRGLGSVLQTYLDAWRQEALNNMNGSRHKDALGDQLVEEGVPQLCQVAVEN